MLHHMLWDIFVAVFESRFALWVGSSCCPHIETSQVAIPYVLPVFILEIKTDHHCTQSNNALICRLMLTLDNHRGTEQTSS
jgi:hypothetical protein